MCIHVCVWCVCVGVGTILGLWRPWNMFRQEKGGLLYVRLWKGLLKNTMRSQSKRTLIVRGFSASEGRLSREDGTLERLSNQERFDGWMRGNDRVDKILIQIDLNKLE